MEEEKIIRHIVQQDYRKEPNELLDWVGKSEENKKKFIGYRNLWALMQQGNELDSEMVSSELQHFKKRIHKNNRRVILYSFRKYAAVIVFLLTLGGGYFLGHNSLRNVNDTYTTITCAFGDKTAMVLPDSSKVWLNSGSTLRFNNNFQQRKREVFLEGEAYFSVEKDKTRPFRVTTPEASVEVLGTEFNLKAYPEEKEVSATLITGKINFSSSQKKTTLLPNQKLVYNKNNQKTTVYKLSDSYPEIEWKDGRMVFRNESLESLELKLERWFDVDIAFADEAVKKQCFTGSLERESILDALYYFKFSKYVDYSIKGNEITFFSANESKR